MNSGNQYRSISPGDQAFVHAMASPSQLRQLNGVLALCSVGYCIAMVLLLNPYGMVRVSHFLTLPAFSYFDLPFVVLLSSFIVGLLCLLVFALFAALLVLFALPIHDTYNSGRAGSSQLPQHVTSYLVQYVLHPANLLRGIQSFPRPPSLCPTPPPRGSLTLLLCCVACCVA